MLVLKELSFRQKEYLIREKIPFIVDGKQIYLPFMAVYLQERCSAEKIPREEILPSAQMLLLHFIYGGAQELSTSQAAKDLGLTPTSISRASRQLEEMGLLHIRKVGVQRIMQSEGSSKTLFQKAGDKFLNPIKRTVYIPKEYVGTDLLESGYSALALREDTDERVEEAVEEMLNELWRKNDVFRLTELIDPTVKIVAPQGVYADIQEFVQRMKNENVDIKQLGVVGRTKEKILKELKGMYETL